MPFVVYSDTSTGTMRRVIRYGECPPGDELEQASSGEISAAVIASELANFYSTAALVEGAETGGASEAWMTYNPSSGAIGYAAISVLTSDALVLQRRAALLADSDWTQLADAPLTAAKKAEWATYRQSLRDIPQQSGYPGSVNWPTAPS